MSGDLKPRDEYKAVAAELNAIEAKIAAAAEPFSVARSVAEGRLYELEEAIGAGGCLGRCPSCETPIFENDKSYHCVDEDPFCEACAPTWADLLTSESFVDGDEVELTLEARQALYDAHIAVGGKPTDSMAN